MINKDLIVRKEVDATHYYFVDGEFYPSVSAILDEAAPKEYGLLNFFKTNTPEDIEEKSSVAKAKGSLVHDTCEKILNGVKVSIVDFPIPAKKALMTFIDWYNTYQPKNYLTESTVASMKFKYAGTCDMICEIDNKKVLIDFKTNKGGIYPSNKLQVMAYKQAYEETNDEKIDECWILRLGTTHKVGYEFKKIDDVTVDNFMDVYKTYLWLHGGKVPEPPVIDVYPEELELSNISLRK
jgi:hypothetical protein